MGSDSSLLSCSFFITSKPIMVLDDKGHDIDKYSGLTGSGSGMIPKNLGKEI